MRKNILLPLVAALALGSTAAFAVLDNSHHDMTIYQGDDQLCWQCHGRTDTNNVTAILGDVGSVGGLCVGRCHSGTGVVTANNYVVPMHPDYPTYTDSVTAANTVAGAADYTILYFTNAHGDDPALLLDPYTGVSFGAAAVAATGWPYSGAANMQCSTCHAVHDNANTPFAWDSFTGGAFCVNCHTGRDTNDLTGAPDGNHPVNFNINSAAAAARTLAPAGAVAGRNGRRISVDAASPGRYFDVASANGAGLNGAGQSDVASYMMGGKLDSFANWADAAEVLSCYTCHAVHTTAYNNMIVAPWTSESTSVGQNPICMGCHGAGATVADNYNYSFAADGNVGVTNFGHGVNAEAALTGGNYVTSVGNFTITVTNPGAPSIWGPAATGEVMCSSCHDIHGGRDNIVLNTGSFAGVDPICTVCHDGSGLPDVTDISEAGAGEGANAHHRTSTAAFATGVDGDALNLVGAASWLAAETGAAGDLSDGLQCSDCHISNGTAHNW